MTKVFLICPVRNATEEQLVKMDKYIKKLESDGCNVFYPTRDNPYEHTDDVGYIICETNVKAIRDADEVHIFFDKDSKGSLFDIGASFGLNKKIVLANKDEIVPTEYKSFSNMIIEWASKSS